MRLPIGKTGDSGWRGRRAGRLTGLMVAKEPQREQCGMRRPKACKGKRGVWRGGRRASSRRSLEPRLRGKGRRWREPGGGREQADLGGKHEKLGRLAWPGPVQQRDTSCRDVETMLAADSKEGVVSWFGPAPGSLAAMEG